jgi:hypothetical protein
MKTYKVVEYHLIPEAKSDLAMDKEMDKKKKPPLVSEYRTIQAGMTWMDAKELRKINSHYMIVPEQ